MNGRTGGRRRAPPRRRPRDRRADVLLRLGRVVDQLARYQHVPGTRVGDLQVHRLLLPRPDLDPPLPRLLRDLRRLAVLDDVLATGVDDELAVAVTVALGASPVAHRGDDEDLP